MIFDLEDEEGSASTETADFSAVLPSANDEESSEAEAEAPASPEAEAAAPPEEEVAPEAEVVAPPEAEAAAPPEEEVAPEAEEEEDTRWRFRSGSGLVLFFPTYEVASKWIIKQNPAEISIAYGSGEFRLYSSFEAQLKTTGDPMAAILSAASEAEPTEAAAAGEGSSEAPQDGEASPDVLDPVAEVSPPGAKPRGGDSVSSRATTMTSDFQFRTGKDVNVWPGRALFLVLGLLLGAGGVYYVAWYGLLPGILY